MRHYQLSLLDYRPPPPPPKAKAKRWERAKRAKREEPPPPVEPDTAPPVALSVLEPGEILDALETQRTQRLDSAWGRSEPRTLYSSDIGECDRQLVLHKLAWSIRQTPDQFGLQNMEDGREAEKIIVRQLRDEGHVIVRDQMPFNMASRTNPAVIVLTGKPEGFFEFRLPGERPQYVPFEIKATSYWKFEALRCELDLMRDPWTRKWWRQFQSYLLGFGHDWGVFIVAHRGARRAFIVQRDESACAEIVDRAERTAATVAALAGAPLDALGERLDALSVAYGPPSSCRYCDMSGRVCFPPMTAPGDAPEIAVLSPELEDRVLRLVELAPLKQEYDRLDRWLTKEVPKGTHGITGDTVISWESVEQNTKAKAAVPAQDAKPAGTREQWKRSIVSADNPQEGSSDDNE